MRTGRRKLGLMSWLQRTRLPQTLIRDAYKVEDDQIVGAPSWLNSRRYDIDAKVDSPATGQGGERMLQGLLSDYFKLAVHPETRLIPVYELVVGDGPKLRESAPAYADFAARVIQVERGLIVGREVPIPTLARILSEQLCHPVLDNTQKKLSLPLRCHIAVADSFRIF